MSLLSQFILALSLNFFVLINPANADDKQNEILQLRIKLDQISQELDMLTFEEKVQYIGSSYEKLISKKRNSDFLKATAAGVSAGMLLRASNKFGRKADVGPFADRKWNNFLSTSTGLGGVVLGGLTLYYIFRPTQLGDGTIVGSVCFSPDFFITEFVLSYTPEDRKDFYAQECVTKVIDDNYSLQRSLELGLNIYGL